MSFTFAHNCIYVYDLEKSLAFYREALGLTEKRRLEHGDGEHVSVFLDDGNSSHMLELTWSEGRTDPYNLGDNEMHIAFVTEDFDKAHELHSDMGCICMENKNMGIYFISDPDGYWLEIIPSRKKS